MSGKYGGELALWDAVTGKNIWRRNVHEAGAVSSVTFSPDGKKILSSGDDYSLRLTDAASGNELWKADCDSAFLATAFSSDGKTAAASGWAGSVVTFDADSGNMLGKFSGRTNAVNSVAFSSDGAFLLTNARDGTVRLWNLKSGGFVAFSAGLSPNQWVTWTDDGFWDGSLDCDFLVGAAKGLESYNVDQFAVRYNRPDIILTRLGKADSDYDGTITTDDLRAYVIDAVTESSDGLQHPTVDRDNLYRKFGFRSGL